MCGIAGELNWSKKPNPAYLEPVIEAMIHRGPDAGALESLDYVVLGHRRLSVIDTRSVSNQPLWDVDRQACIVFNGEIYNFKQVRRELELQGSRFTTRSDTEVILQAYLRWGVDCLDKLVGMFAFGIWDVRNQRLFLARDRLGEKPLYYFEKPSGLIFASELKAIKRHPECPQEINADAVNQFLSLNYILTESCILKGVKKLPSAHYLLISKGDSGVLCEYWSLKKAFLNKPEWTSYQAAQNHLNSLLDASLDGQVIADVPLGAFLSGGIDSSTIVAHMKPICGVQQTKTYSIGFEESSYSELSESRSASSFLSVEHNTKVIHPNISEQILKIVEAFDEPFADTSMIPTYFLCEFTRQKVTVALSGDGGDELFLGYETYIADQLHQMISKWPSVALSGLSRIVEKFMPVSFNKVSFDYKVRQFLKGSQLPFEDAHYSWRTIFSEQEKNELLVDANVTSKNPSKSFHHFFEDVTTCHFLDQASYVDMKTWLVDDILVKVDRAAMAHSLETRAPFLDHRLVEFAAGLPVDWKLKGVTKKAILKASQADYLPSKILYRKKKGFNAPVSFWLCGDMNELGKQATYETPLLQWIRKSALNKLWQEHESQQRDNGLKLFGLTCLGLWLEQHRQSQLQEKG